MSNREYELRHNSFRKKETDPTSLTKWEQQKESLLSARNEYQNLVDLIEKVLMNQKLEKKSLEDQQTWGAKSWGTTTKLNFTNDCCKFYLFNNLYNKNKIHEIKMLKKIFMSIKFKLTLIYKIEKYLFELQRLRKNGIMMK